MSLTTVAQLRALVPATQTESQLQEVIDREEYWLAHELRGTLAGSRIQTFYVGDPSAMGLWVDTRVLLPGSPIWMMSDRMGLLWLLRHTDTATIAGTPPQVFAVVDNGVDVTSDIRLVKHGTAVERASGGWNGPIVTVTYTPVDSLEVQRVTIELCRLTLTETGFYSEMMGEYRYMKRDTGQDENRLSLVRKLKTHLPLSMIHVQTASEDDRVGAVGNL